MVAKLRVSLKYPNLAVDQFGNLGTWTMVYNQVYLSHLHKRVGGYTSMLLLEHLFYLKSTAYFKIDSIRAKML